MQGYDENRRIEVIKSYRISFIYPTMVIILRETDLRRHYVCGGFSFIYLHFFNNLFIIKTIADNHYYNV